MELPARKPTRLPNFDYSTPGAYFITICTKDRKCILGNIVGGGALDAPQMQTNHIGKMVEKYILSGNKTPYVHVDKYVIMPNHIHMILLINNGASRASSPTNAVIPRFVSALKRFCNQDTGFTIFQRSYHDHIIRNEQDYLRIWEYIDNNPVRWKEDCFYTE